MVKSTNSRNVEVFFIDYQTKCSLFTYKNAAYRRHKALFWKWLPLMIPFFSIVIHWAELSILTITTYLKQKSNLRKSSCCLCWVILLQKWIVLSILVYFECCATSTCIFPSFLENENVNEIVHSPDWHEWGKAYAKRSRKTINLQILSFEIRIVGDQRLELAEMGGQIVELQMQPETAQLTPLKNKQMLQQAAAAETSCSRCLHRGCGSKWWSSPSRSWRI